jgi:FMN phosphatase YigB (HAD superfamily)
MSCPEGQVVVFDLIGVLARPSWRELCAAPDLAAWRRLRVGAITEAEFWSPEMGRMYRAALGLRGDRVALLRRLRAEGRTIVIASNFAREWVATIQARMPAGLVARWVISGEVGVAKPDLAFWPAVDVPAGTVVVDDQARNVAAATAAGLRGLWAAPGVDLAAALARALADAG